MYLCLAIAQVFSCNLFDLHAPTSLCSFPLHCKGILDLAEVYCFLLHTVVVSFYKQGFRAVALYCIIHNTSSIMIYMFSIPCITSLTGHWMLKGGVSSYRVDPSEA